MSTAADLLVEALTAGGLDTCFGVPGVDTLPLYAALEHRAGTNVIVRHEATAAYAADACFRVAGRPAACLTTGGPGAANTAGAMGEAWASSSTLLHLTTTVTSSSGAAMPRGLPHYHPRQLAQFEGIARHAVHCDDPGQLAAVARECLVQLALVPHAPVLLQVPLDLLEREVAPEMVAAAAAPVHTAPPVTVTGLDESVVKAAAAALAAARAPIIWAGSGSLGAEADLVAIAETLNAPIIVSHSAKRRFRSASHPLVVTFPPHEPAVAELLAASDVLLAVGTDLDAMMTRQFRLTLPARLVQVDVEPTHIGMRYPVSEAVIARAEEALPAIRACIGEALARTGEAQRGGDSGRAAQARERAWADQAEGDMAPARSFLERLDATLPGDAVVVCDMAVAGYWAAGYLSLSPHRQVLYPMGWGTLGWGLPAAIGASVSAGGRRVVLVSGDAGLLYAAGELATVSQCSLPLSIVVVDDGGYGMLRFAGEARFGRTYDMDLRSPDFARLAGAFDIEGRAMPLGAEGEPSALRTAFETAGPSLLVLHGSLVPPRMSRLWE